MGRHKVRLCLMGRKKALICHLEFGRVGNKKEGYKIVGVGGFDVVLIRHCYKERKREKGEYRYDVTDLPYERYKEIKERYLKDE